MKLDKSITNDLAAYMNTRADIPDGWLYLGDSKERYVLGQPGQYNLMVVGVNPSTAVPNKDDQTIRKVRQVVATADYDGWIMVNLYPQITKDPDQLDVAADSRLTAGNIQVIQALFKQYMIGGVWAAWGDLIDKRYYLGKQLVKIEAISTDCEWYYKGTLTKKGNPRHPLYMKTDEQFECFPVWDYACAWMEL